YRLLETVRQYAQDRLLEAREADAVRLRHQDFFLAFAEGTAEKLWGPEQDAWFERLEKEHDNFRTLLAWLPSSPAGDAPESELRLVAALARLWDTRGYVREGAENIRRALARTGAFPVLQHSTVRAKVLLSAGWAAHLQDDLAAARRSYEGALEIYGKAGDRLGAARMMGLLGQVATSEGDLETARASLEEALAIGRDLGNLGLVAMTLGSLGHVAFLQSHLAEARRCTE